MEWLRIPLSGWLDGNALGAEDELAALLDPEAPVP